MQFNDWLLKASMARHADAQADYRRHLKMAEQQFVAQPFNVSTVAVEAYQGHVIDGTARRLPSEAPHV